MTAPHEVAHAFTNLIYNSFCRHDKRWEEVMEYLNLPAEEFLEVPSRELFAQLASQMKFFTTVDAMKWEKGLL